MDTDFLDTEPKKPRKHRIKKDLYAVKLLRNYNPADASGKIPAGSELLLPYEEATRVIESKIGVRNDPYTPS